MELDAFELTIDDGVAHIIWNQPERGNPFDGTFCREYSALAVECDENPRVRAVLMEARGRYFSVGGDLKAFGSDRDALPHKIKSWSAPLHAGISRFARMDAPVIIACHSLVTGGAVALTAAADFAYASADARFYAAFAGIGFASDAGSTYHLARRVGQRRALDFLLRNLTWNAEQACRYGLINEVLADEASLRERSHALAHELANGPTLAYGEIKRLMLSTFDQPLETQIELEAQALARMARTDDAWNALQAVARREKAVFAGRCISARNNRIRTPRMVYEVLARLFSQAPHGAARGCRRGTCRSECVRRRGRAWPVPASPHRSSAVARTGKHGHRRRRCRPRWSRCVR